MTELILIRHGETEWNRELRFQGQVDVPLNAAGHEQARRLADRLAQEEPIDALISSDLLRARQTAQALLRPTHALQLDPGLREQSFGRVDGWRVAEIKAREAQAWAEWTRFDPDYAFEGGESIRVFHARVMSALHALVAQHAGRTVLVVTHGGVLDMVYRSALGLSLAGPRQSQIPNAGLNRVRFQTKGIEILSWADTLHLADLPPQPIYDQQRVARVSDPT